LKKVAILGGTGYTGIELLRLLWFHPEVEVSFISSESRQGEELAEVHPHFAGLSSELTFLASDPEEVPADVEVAFCALPHGSSAETAKALKEKGIRVIDLSADLRLKEPELYQDWYGRVHPFPELLDEAVYGLPEVNHQLIKAANLVANPGCYPTSVLLALLPLAREGMLPERGLVVDSKSGVTGAGRAPSQAFHFPECNESFKAYRVASHQHIPEMEQELSACLGRKVNMSFTPHLIPINRGILSTAYLPFTKELQEEKVRELYREFYNQAIFVHLLRKDLFPETRWVKGSNYCHLNIKWDQRTNTLIVISALDNLVKGAAGQAVQNMNLMFDLPEATGLRQPALVP